MIGGESPRHTFACVLGCALHESGHPSLGRKVDRVSIGVHWRALSGQVPGFGSSFDRRQTRLRREVDRGLAKSIRLFNFVVRSVSFRLQTQPKLSFGIRADSVSRIGPCIAPKNRVVRPLAPLSSPRFWITLSSTDPRYMPRLRRSEPPMRSVRDQGTFACHPSRSKSLQTLGAKMAIG